MKHSKKTVIGGVIGTVLVLAGAVIGVEHRAVRMVFKNLTAAKLPIDEKDASWDGGDSFLKIPYAEDSDSQYLDLYMPSDTEKPPLFVLVHGGGFIANDSQSRQAQLMYRYFRDHGYACATINYRLAQEAAFPAGLCDVKAAVRFLKSHEAEYGYDASHPPIWGESAGGYLAAMTAFTNDAEFMDVRYIGQDEDEAAGNFISAKTDVLVDYYGAVELAGNADKRLDWEALHVPQMVIDVGNGWVGDADLQGFTDVESFWLRKEVTEMTEEEKAVFAVYPYIEENLHSEDAPAVMIVHGDCDITVPYLESQRLYEKLLTILPENKVDFLLAGGLGHAADMLYSDDILSQVDAFIKDHTAKA